VTVFLRSAPSSLGESTKLTRSERVKALYRDSQMKVNAACANGSAMSVIIGISGPLAKLPSTSNSRMLTVPRMGVLKSIQTMIESPGTRTHTHLHALKNSVRSLRAMMTRNPDHVDQLTALTALWNSATQGEKIKFDLDADNRGAVYIFLSPLMNRMDSHNIPKAFCDWIQEIGLIPNDKYVDAYARRAIDFGMPGQESFIVIERYDSRRMESQNMQWAASVLKGVYGTKFFVDKKEIKK